MNLWMPYGRKKNFKIARISIVIFMNKKAIAGVVAILLSAFIVLGFMSLSSSRIDKVYIKVIYDGRWEGVIEDNLGKKTWRSNGDHVQELERPEGVDAWFVSAYAQKLDGSVKPISIKIYLEDQTLLAEDSNQHGFGVAHFTVEITRPNKF